MRGSDCVVAVETTSANPTSAIASQNQRKILRKRLIVIVDGREQKIKDVDAFDAPPPPPLSFSLSAPLRTKKRAARFSCLLFTVYRRIDVADAAHSLDAFGY